MTVAEAAKQWIKGKKLEREAKALMSAPEKILKAHFQKSGRREYKGVISYSATTYKSLDTAAVKEMLGERVSKFLITRTRETLSLLERQSREE